MTTTQALLALTVAAVAAIVTGVVLAFGAPWGFIAGGVLALAGVVVLYDPNTKR